MFWDFFSFVFVFKQTDVTDKFVYLCDQRDWEVDNEVILIFSPELNSDPDDEGSDHREANMNPTDHSQSEPLIRLLPESLLVLETVLANFFEEGQLVYAEA